MPSDGRAALIRFIDAVNGRDAEAAVAACHPDVEFASVLASVDGQPFRGHAGIRAYFTQVSAAWEEWRIELERVEDHGDRLAVVFAMSVRGRESGAHFRQRLGHVWELRDGRLWRCTSFADPADAVDAARNGAPPDADDPRDP